MKPICTESNCERTAKAAGLCAPHYNATKSCSVSGCGLTHLARGLCRKHWGEWRETADAAQLRYHYTSLEESFTAWPRHENESGCIIWGGNTSGYAPMQYGVLTFRNGRRGAHRVAYELKHGTIPRGMDVDHLCHTRLCVNPDHLRLATRKQNQEHRRGANRNSLTGVRGVTFDKKRPVGKQYKAKFRHNYRDIHVGRFATIQEAEAAVTAARRELFTHSNHDNPQE